MIENLVRKNILDLQPYSSARDDFKGNGEVYLDANENPIIGNGLNRYPDSQHEQLRSIISEKVDIPINQILLGNGSDEIIDLLIRCFCEPANDEIITLPPTYGMYSVCANINNVKVKEIFLAKNFGLPVSGIIDAQTEKTKLLFICSPNNPTGNQMSMEEVEELLKRFNGVLVIDEAYVEFAEVSSLGLLSKYKNLVLMRTFSKARGLAGIRLGMAFASEELIEILNKIKPPYNLNTLTQEEAIIALKDDGKLEENIQYILIQKDWLRNELTQLDSVLIVYPSDANFLLVKFKRNATIIYKELVKKGIVVRNRSNLPLCENCLRITVGTEKENEKLIEELKTIET